MPFPFFIHPFPFNFRFILFCFILFYSFYPFYDVFLGGFLCESVSRQRQPPPRHVAQGRGPCTDQDAAGRLQASGVRREMQLYLHVHYMYVCTSHGVVGDRGSTANVSALATAASRQGGDGSGWFFSVWCEYMTSRDATQHMEIRQAR